MDDPGAIGRMLSARQAADSSSDGGGGGGGGGDGGSHGGQGVFTLNTPKFVFGETIDAFITRISSSSTMARAVSFGLTTIFDAGKSVFDMVIGNFLSPEMMQAFKIPTPTGLALPKGISGDKSQGGH